jgi:very-short-patch-repair endonuclease
VCEAARLGGRLTCVSELRRRGVFVLERPQTHVHLAANASRHRRPREGVHRHWDRLLRQPHPRSCTVEGLDAVRQAVLCQEPRGAVATIDSALRCGVIRRDELSELFASLPRRYRVLSRLIDERAESGPESLMRLLLRRLGLTFDVQVKIAGVGRVDFVVAGWLIIECDSEAHHGGWDARRRDLRRDQAAAALGYCTFRPIAEDILWHQDRVLAALRGLLTHAQRRP